MAQLSKTKAKVSSKRHSGLFKSSSKGDTNKILIKSNVTVDLFSKETKARKSIHSINELNESNELPSNDLLQTRNSTKNAIEHIVKQLKPTTPQLALLYDIAHSFLRMHEIYIYLKI